jgi:CRP-like cAMP-binding protein
MTHGSLIDLLRGGLPALAALVIGVAVIRIVCRRPTLRRLSLALPLVTLTGSVALFRVLAPGGSAERTPATLGPGDYFGEMSLLTGAPRSATIRAEEETSLAILRKEALRPLLAADPTVPERRASQLVTRMRRFFGLVGDPAGRG